MLEKIDRSASSLGASSACRLSTDNTLPGEGDEIEFSDLRLKIAQSDEPSLIAYRSYRCSCF